MYLHYMNGIRNTLQRLILDLEKCNARINTNIT